MYFLLFPHPVQQSLQDKRGQAHENNTETLLAGFPVQASTAAVSAHGSSRSFLIIWKKHTRAGVVVQAKEEKAINSFAVA